MLLNDNSSYGLLSLCVDMDNTYVNFMHISNVDKIYSRVSFSKVVRPVT